jgi:hypothetical protein
MVTFVLEDYQAGSLRWRRSVRRILLVGTLVATGISVAGGMLFLIFILDGGHHPLVVIGFFGLVLITMTLAYMTGSSDREVRAIEARMREHGIALEATSGTLERLNRYPLVGFLLLSVGMLSATIALGLLLPEMDLSDTIVLHFFVLFFGGTISAVLGIYQLIVIRNDRKG